MEPNRGRWRVDRKTGKVVKDEKTAGPDPEPDEETEEERRRREARERGPYL